MTQDSPTPTWSEPDSRLFIDYGRYFIPERELQIQIICDLIPLRQPLQILELCCGEGLLAQALLERFPASIIHCYDGSAEMLRQAQVRLAGFGHRVQFKTFDLVAPDWRVTSHSWQAIVSSLAIHHLDNAQKQTLYSDLYRLLNPNGVLIIADVIQPAHPLAVALAAKLWDEQVYQRALALDGHTQVYDFFRQQQWNLYHYPDPMDKPSRLADQLKWLEAAGFAEVDVYWLKAGHAIFGGRKGNWP
jgi:ubiquinone/menaquinone biosynthesis C-methylase UbiE